MTAPGAAPGDRLISTVRTVVPSLWAAVVVWLVTWLTDRGAPADVISTAGALGQLGELVLVPLCLAGVHAGARWLEQQPWTPRLLVTLLLGSTAQPTYAAVRHVAPPGQGG